MPEKDPEAHFKKYTGFRPQNLSSRHPEYSPERDFGQISQWLKVVRNLIHTDQGVEYFRDHAMINFAWNLSEPSQLEQFRKECDRAWLLLVRFLECAGGSPILDKDQASVQTDEEIEQMPSYTECMNAVYEFDNKRALIVVMSMMGFCAMDMLFFAARQDRYIGRQGLLTLDEALPSMQYYAAGVLSGKPNEDIAADFLKEAGKLAAMCGYSRDEAAQRVRDAVSSVVEKQG